MWGGGGGPEGLWYRECERKGCEVVKRREGKPEEKMEREMNRREGGLMGLVAAVVAGWGG